MTININQRFKSVIPPLTEDEYRGLEESILADGCRDPLVLWKDTLVDGHNRYEICTKHGIEFKTIQKEFDSEEDVEFWIIKNQLSRRNIGPGTRIILAKKLEPWLREKARERQSEAGGDKRSEEAKIASANVGESNSAVVKPIDVREEIAKAANVSHGTLDKFDKVQKKRPDLIEKVLSGEKTINKAYTTMKEDSEKEQADDLLVNPINSQEENKKNVEKGNVLIKDIWKILDEVDKFSSKHKPDELDCLVHASSADREMIVGKIQFCKKILTKISNSFSAV